MNLEVGEAVLLTVAYADVFDWPVKAEEVYRYLVGAPAGRAQVRLALEAGVRSGRLAYEDPYYYPAGRASPVPIRLRRAQVARRLWPRAESYGRLMAGLPYVRGVSVTGALAVGSVEAGADLDYLVVTEPDRLWLCRALVILLVRWAAIHGDEVCPNYFLTRRALQFDRPNFYSAHEFLRMAPLAGWGVYREMLAANRWAQYFLPNAYAWRAQAYAGRHDPGGRRAAAFVERCLQTPPGDRFERWERERKQKKFNARLRAAGTQAPDKAEAGFCDDWCKGHFNGHAARIYREFQLRAERLGAAQDGGVDGLWYFPAAGLQPRGVHADGEAA